MNVKYPVWCFSRFVSLSGKKLEWGWEVGNDDLGLISMCSCWTSWGAPGPAAVEI